MACVTRISSNPVQKTQVSTQIVCTMSPEGTCLATGLNMQHCSDLSMPSAVNPGTEWASLPRHLSMLVCPCCLPGWAEPERCSRHRECWPIDGSLQRAACVLSPEPYLLCMPGTHYKTTRSSKCHLNTRCCPKEQAGTTPA